MLSPLPSITLPGDPSTYVSAVTTRIEVEKIDTLARLTPITAACSLFAALILITIFWGQGHREFLLVLGGSLLLGHGLALWKSILWRRSPKPTEVAPFLLKVRIGLTALLASIWGVMPIILMPDASASKRQLVIYVVSALISAGVIMAPIRAAAFAFSIITALGALVAVLMVHEPNTLEHIVLILTYTSVTVGVIQYLHARFISQVEHEVQLTEQRELISLLLRDFEETASDWLWETNVEGRFKHVSDRMSRVAGLSVEALQQVSLLEVSTGAAAQGHVAARHLLEGHRQRTPFRDLVLPVQLEDRQQWWSLTAKPVFSGQGLFLGYRGVGTDVTAVRHSEDRIAYLACYDSLTDLCNRVMFQEKLRRTLDEGKPFALLSLDLDGFKSVNDSLGHAGGDTLLRAAAKRIENCVREGDVVGRLGGDEFAVLQAGGDFAGATELANRIISRVSEIYNVDGCTAGIGVSIGIMIPTDESETSNELLKGADLALYRAKAEGRGTWRIFNSEMDARAEARRMLQSDLRQALENNEFALHFQPIISLATHEVEEVEALLRWTHPRRGLVAPSDFIPIAEESGLIISIGAWVIRQACREAMLLPASVRVAVNLSPAQLRDPHLLSTVKDALDESGLPPERLELEITETIFLDASTTVLATLNALRMHGIQIALDDFGTGYSSLSYLRSFSFNKVKIDRSFIRDLSGSTEANAIVRAITGMAGSLGMATTAEGVENQEQLDLLRRSGCEQVQGFLFSRAIPMHSVVQLILEGGMVSQDALAV